MPVYNINVLLFWKLIKVYFGRSCIIKIYCKRGVLCANMSAYPALVWGIWTVCYCVIHIPRLVMTSFYYPLYCMLFRGLLVSLERDTSFHLRFL